MEVSLYGAASGRRGGFFTGGYTLGVEGQLIDNWIFDSSIYVGAGEVVQQRKGED